MRNYGYHCRNIVNFTLRRPAFVEKYPNPTLPRLMNKTQLSLVTMVALSLLSPVVKAQKYTVTDLGVGNVPVAINNNGQVLLRSDKSPSIYSKGKIIYLGMLPGDTISYPTGLNDSGEAVGNSGSSRSKFNDSFNHSFNHIVANDGGGITIIVGNVPPWHAFLYSRGRLINLGMGQAHGINNSEVIIGDFKTKSNVDFEVLYTGGRLVSLGSFPIAWLVDMIAINNAGQAVGTLEIPNKPSCTIIYHNGHTQNIGTFQPNAMNDAGQVVGSTAGGSVTGFACLYANGRLTNLGTLAGTNGSTAQCINDNGEIIGVCFPPDLDANPPQPFLYKGGVMHALTTPGWTVYELTGLNNAGQIVGNGVTLNENSGESAHGGPVHGVLLTPM
jgi:probable HAF family extracellular repeat protein